MTVDELATKYEQRFQACKDEARELREESFRQCCRYLGRAYGARSVQISLSTLSGLLEDPSRNKGQVISSLQQLQKKMKGRLDNAPDHPSFAMLTSMSGEAKKRAVEGFKHSYRDAVEDLTELIRRVKAEGLT